MHTRYHVNLKLEQISITLKDGCHIFRTSGLVLINLVTATSMWTEAVNQHDNLSKTFLCHKQASGFQISKLCFPYHAFRIRRKRLSFFTTLGQQLLLHITVYRHIFGHNRLWSRVARLTLQHKKACFQNAFLHVTKLTYLQVCVFDTLLERLAA